MIKKENGDFYINFKLKYFLYFIIFVLTIITYKLKESFSSENINFFDYYYIKRMVEKSYYKDKDINFYKTGIKGLINNLDEYSIATDNKNAFNYRENYKGIGIQLTSDDKGVQIIKIFDNSDLFGKANVGDYILEINGFKYNGDYNSFIKSLKSDIDTISLKIEDLNSGEIKDIEVRKKIFDNKYYNFEMIDESLYLKINDFSSNITSKLFDEYYDYLKEYYFNGLIIDLRDNGGGLLNEAVKLSDLFISDKNSLLLKTQFKEHEEEYYSNENGELAPTVPIVILINENTASAAEVFSGILKHFNRAYLIGDTTYGKGVGQSVFDYKDIKISFTTFEFLIAGEKKINNIGIEPHEKISYQYKARYDLKNDVLIKSGLDYLRTKSKKITLKDLSAYNIFNE